MKINLFSIKYIFIISTFFHDIKINFYSIKINLHSIRYRGVATGGGGGREGASGAMGTPLQLPNRKRSNSFSFKHQGYCFL